MLFPPPILTKEQIAKHIEDRYLVRSCFATPPAVLRSGRRSAARTQSASPLFANLGFRFLEVSGFLEARSHKQQEEDPPDQHPSSRGCFS
jgi:hypothetical protein